MIERLELDDTAKYDAIEAAVHLNRYALVKPLCAGKKVLDAACGEGYGSCLIKKWGAAHVDGIDINEVAVNKASQFFQDEGVSFHLHDVQQLPFEDCSYDLIVSFETMEHVDDPEKFLNELRRVLKPDGILILSCPNDPYYFEKDNHQNPFHKRTYTFYQFKEIAEKSFGKEVSYFLGFGLEGFCNIPFESSTLPPEKDNEQSSTRILRDEMFSYSNVDSAICLPQQAYSNHWNCNYYVGIWGGSGHTCKNSTVFFPRPIFIDRHDIDHDFLRHVEEMKKILLAGGSFHDLLNARDELTYEKDQLSLKMTSIQKESDNLLAENDRLGTVLSSITEERDSLVAEIDSLGTMLSSITEERDSLVAEIDRLGAMLNSITEERDDARQEMHVNWKLYQKELKERDNNILQLDRMQTMLALITVERDTARQEMYNNWDYYQKALMEKEDNWTNYQKALTEKEDNWMNYQKALTEREENWAHYQTSAKRCDELEHELDTIKKSRSYRLLLLYRRVVGNRFRRFFSKR